MKLHEVVILDGVRTAIGSFGGSLSSLTPADLGEVVAREAIARSGVPASEVDHSIFGHIITTSKADVYLSRDIALRAGLSTDSAALNVNRLCGSAVQSVISAVQLLMLGDCNVALAGGAESMSNGAYLAPTARKGARMGDTRLVDMTLGILSDPFGSGHMGITAENIAEQQGYTRDQVDRYAADSHAKACNAINKGYFESQIVPVEVTKKRETVIFNQDEHPRPSVSVESLASLKPAFKRDGLVTAGNASGINDGAAAMVLTTRDEADKRGLLPRCKVLGYAFSGISPNLMGLGPVSAVKKALENTGISMDQLDVIESNEAFAAQAMGVNELLNLPLEKVNPNGGAVALGHPVGATGSILIVKAMHELERTGGQYGLITMCIGGGQGIALIIENLRR